MSLIETKSKSPQRVLITGTAGFIGFHLAQLLLAEGFQVHGYDGITDYYDVNLKRRRHQMLMQHPSFEATEGMLEEEEKLCRVAERFQPEVIVHLAAQAGVRYSLENPRAYIDSNIVGTFNVMEAARKLAVSHLLMASTSSVYGANEDIRRAYRRSDYLEARQTQQRHHTCGNALYLPPPEFCKACRSAF